MPQNTPETQATVKRYLRDEWGKSAVVQDADNKQQWVCPYEHKGGGTDMVTVYAKDIAEARTAVAAFTRQRGGKPIGEPKLRTYKDGTDERKDAGPETEHTTKQLGNGNWVVVGKNDGKTYSSETPSKGRAESWARSADLMEKNNPRKDSTDTASGPPMTAKLDASELENKKAELKKLQRQKEQGSPLTSASELDLQIKNLTVQIRKLSSQPSRLDSALHAADALYSRSDAMESGRWDAKGPATIRFMGSNYSEEELRRYIKSQESAAAGNREAAEQMAAKFEGRDKQQIRARWLAGASANDSRVKEAKAKLDELLKSSGRSDAMENGR